MEPVQPFQADLLGANGPVSPARLWIAVPVASAGAQGAEPQGDVGEPRSQVGIVTRVPGFHGIEAFALEPLDEGPGAPLFQVGHRYQSSRGMNQLRDGAE